MDMIEKVARAVAAYADKLPSTSADAPFIRSHRIALARAAIGAMREPTEEMLSAGSDHFMDEWTHPPTAAERLWQDMIDAALKTAEEK